MLNGITLGIIITLVLLFLCIILSILVTAIIGPLSKTPNDVLDEIADLIDVKKKDTFLDLGSGDGRLVFKVYERYKCKCFGYDISPLLVIFSNLMRDIKFPFVKDIVFEIQNIYKVDISKANKIYCFLDENSLRILRPRLEKFVKDGGVVYSYENGIKDMKGEKKVVLRNKKGLYIYSK